MILIAGLMMICQLEFIDHNMQTITVKNIPAKVLYKTEHQTLVKWDESVIKGMPVNQLMNDEFLLVNCKEQK
jgi:hypothetical protein